MCAAWNKVIIQEPGEVALFERRKFDAEKLPFLYRDRRNLSIGRFSHQGNGRGSVSELVNVWCLDLWLDSCQGGDIFVPGRIVRRAFQSRPGNETNNESESESNNWKNLSHGFAT